jgi:hypothetical protein
MNLEIGKTSPSISPKKSEGELYMGAENEGMGVKGGQRGKKIHFQLCFLPPPHPMNIQHNQIYQ